MLLTDLEQVPFFVCFNCRTSCVELVLCAPNNVTQWVCVLDFLGFEVFFLTSRSMQLWTDVCSKVRRAIFMGFVEGVFSRRAAASMPIRLLVSVNMAGPCHRLYDFL